jgi:hypothetical protein
MSLPLERTTIPSVALPIAALPAAFVPIRLPTITFADDSGLRMSIPAPPLPEMTLFATRTASPLSIAIPAPPLPRSAVPSVPTNRLVSSGLDAPSTTIPSPGNATMPSPSTVENPNGADSTRPSVPAPAPEPSR